MWPRSSASLWSETRIQGDLTRAGAAASGTRATSRGRGKVAARSPHASTRAASSDGGGRCRGAPAHAAARTLSSLHLPHSRTIPLLPSPGTPLRECAALKGAMHACAASITLRGCSAVAAPDQQPGWWHGSRMLAWRACDCAWVSPDSNPLDRDPDLGSSCSTQPLPRAECTECVLHCLSSASTACAHLMFPRPALRATTPHMLLPP